MKNNLKEKLCTVEEAVRCIRNGGTVATGGFVGAGHPEAITAEMERQFLERGSPKNLTLVYAAGQGDGDRRGLNHLAHRGMINRVVGGHWGLAPGLGKMAINNEIEGYNFPQGVVCQLFRDIAAGRPGCITHIGMDTFIDPRLNGGKLNNRTREDLVEIIELDGRQWLWYKSFPVHVGLIRGTEADPFGNLLMEEEAVIGEVLPIAQAVKNCGGIVIAQVKRLKEKPSLPQHVIVPGILIDKIVISKPHEHDQTFGEVKNEGYYLPRGVHETASAALEPMPVDARRIIASRAFLEVPENGIANLGIGIPEGIGRIASEKKVLNKLILTLESGPIGGMPAGGLSFGASLYPDAVIDQPAQFDFYDGGGLDFAALGAAQVDEKGNVNVSKFGDRLAGVGGFVNITQTAGKVVFCGTFTTSGLETANDGSKLIILREGKTRKFIPRVEQISFSARQAILRGQKVKYITERAVFQLTPGGLELIEVAPGIDIQTQILQMMDFKPIIRNFVNMPGWCFRRDRGEENE